jgi:hypothetical protein
MKIYFFAEGRKGDSREESLLTSFISLKDVWS